MSSKAQFLGMNFEVFKRQYMLKLYSLGYTDYDTDTDTTQISEEGKRFINEELHELDSLINYCQSLLPSSFHPQVEN